MRCVFVKIIPIGTNVFPGNDRYGWGHVFEEAQMCWFLTIIRSFIRFKTNGAGSKKREMGSCKVVNYAVFKVPGRNKNYFGLLLL
ncbi:MAG: hypothetical protein CVU39_16255 [Chloroflexi bacterium HGW-Chloroflexi-10]|nr:MAG: hypothetical protein CVU39_16255 [Chloroflexi bacterium HGW-Chloroflexi-10]